MAIANETWVLSTSGMGFFTSDQEVRCAICDENNDITVVEEVPESGKAMDLDLRSPSTVQILHTQIHACSRCGYCAPRIEIAPDKPVQIQAFIRTPEYLAALHNAQINCDVARQFLCASLIQEKVIGDLTRAAQLALRAAWACDDDRLDVPAAICRAKAATIFERAISGAPPAATPSQDSSTKVPDVLAQRAMLVDIYRRSGNFARASELANELIVATAPPPKKSSNAYRTEDEEEEEELCNHNNAILRRIARFQLWLCQQNDRLAYNSRDALEFERDAEREAARSSHEKEEHDEDGTPDRSPEDKERVRTGPRVVEMGEDGGVKKDEEQEEEEEKEKDDEEASRGGSRSRGMPRGFPFPFPFMGMRGGPAFRVVSMGGRGDDDDEDPHMRTEEEEVKTAPAPQPQAPPAPASPPNGHNDVD